MTNDEELIGVNERGYRVGESRPGVVLSDHDVDLIRDLYDEPFTAIRFWTYARLAEKFEVSAGYIGKVIRCEKRAQRPVRWRRARPQVR